MTSTSNTFHNCWGAGKGGAIYMAESATFSDNGSNFYNNSALIGGAIYNEKCTLNLLNTKIYKNRANYGGGGIVEA